MSVPHDWIPTAPTPAAPPREHVLAGPRGTDEGPDLVQLLTPEGERVARLEFDAWHVADVDTATLQGLYRDMVLVRRADREATALQRQGEPGIWRRCWARRPRRSAPAALRTGDMAFPSYREHGVAWCRGVDPTELLGVSAARPGQLGPRRHRLPPLHDRHRQPVPQRDRLRDGAEVRGPGRRTERRPPCVLGDGATSQGDVHEGFVWAAVYDAPVVFYCQNNQWATNRTSARPGCRCTAALRLRLPGIRVDGNDVLACLAVSRWALEEAAAATAPCSSRRSPTGWTPTPLDDPTRYRLADELELWKLKDLLERVRVHLVRGHEVGTDFFDEVGAESDALAARLRAHCLAMPQPGPERIFSHVYAEPPPELDARTRDRLLRFLRRGLVRGWCGMTVTTASVTMAKA